MNRKGRLLLPHNLPHRPVFHRLFCTGIIMAAIVTYCNRSSKTVFSCVPVVSAWMTTTSPIRHTLNSNTFSQSSLFSSSTPTPTTTTTRQEHSSTSNTNIVHGRLSRGHLSSMGDARTVTENLPLVLSHLKARRANEETIQAAQKIASLQKERVTLLQVRDAALQLRNEQSAKVGQLMRDSQMDTVLKEKAVEEAKNLSAQATRDAALTEVQLQELETTANAILASLPNLLDDVVADGNNEKDNVEVERWGDLDSLPSLLGWKEDHHSSTFTPKWHDDVATQLGGWHSDKAVAISGARFVALSGPVAKLERAISSFFLDMHTHQHGYTEVSVPFVVSRTALEGTTQLPKFELDLFKIDPNSHTCNGQDAFLIPTAEVPLTNLHRDSILEEADLPLSYVALTPCFRAEAGSYGRDTRGLIRTHQFLKVELVKITSADSSDAQHETLTRHAQNCLEALKLPYRKVRLCSGDIGFSARHCYDLEVWLPGSGEYREISSCSNTGDFQARRMGLRYRPSEKTTTPSSSVSASNSSNTLEEDKNDKNKKKKVTNTKSKSKPVFCHTINGSGLAVGRTLVAVLENYQMPDGSVMVPEVLRPYMGGQEILKPVAATTAM